MVVFVNIYFVYNTISFIYNARLIIYNFRNGLQITQTKIVLPNVA